MCTVGSVCVREIFPNALCLLNFFFHISILKFRPKYSFQTRCVSQLFALVVTFALKIVLAETGDLVLLIKVDLFRHLALLASFHCKWVLYLNLKNYLDSLMWLQQCTLSQIIHTRSLIGKENTVRNRQSACHTSSHLAYSCSYGYKQGMAQLSFL